MAPVPGDSSKYQFGTSMPQGGHPPHHSMTSSASSRSDSGIVRPSASSSSTSSPARIRPRSFAPSWRRKWRNGDAWCARPISGWDSRRRPSVTNVHGSECLAGKGAMRGEDPTGRCIDSSCIRNYATAIRLIAAQGNIPMIDLYYWTTPNGHKITIFLEETGLPYNIMPVNIGKGEQFKSQFLAVSPNNRIPAIVDHAPAG